MKMMEMMKEMRNKKNKNSKGFTLIEMIIVIAIIAILIALIAPNLMEFVQTANDTKVNAAAKTLYTSAQSYVTKMYVANTSVKGGEYSLTSLGTDFATKYFNSEDIEKMTDVVITVTDDGVVSKVSLKMDGKPASYPTEKKPVNPPSNP